MYFSEKFNIKSNGHKDLDFIDVCTKDTRLYVAPYLLSSEWRTVVDSFFDEVVAACRNRDEVRLRELLSHAQEPNECRLGMSSGIPCGRGASSKMLLPYFKTLMDDGLFDGHISRIEDMPIFAFGFDVDRMSDLLINVLREGLWLFTVHQCFKHGINLEENSKVYEKYYWDATKRCWGLKAYPILVMDGLPVLLVPKTIVCRRNSYSVQKYITCQIFSRRKLEHVEQQSPICREKQRKDGTVEILPPTNKALEKEEFTGKKKCRKKYAREQTVAEDLHNFHTLIDCEGQSRGLSDQELDKIVYGGFEVIA